MEIGINTTLSTTTVGVENLLDRIFYTPNDAMQTNLATASISAADYNVAYGTVPYRTVGITGSFLPTLFKCPYCDSYSNEPGICKNCGGVKEIAR